MNQDDRTMGSGTIRNGQITPRFRIIRKVGHALAPERLSIADNGGRQLVLLGGVQGNTTAGLGVAGQDPGGARGDD